MRTSNQLDGTNDDDVIVKENTSKRVNRKKKSRNVQITFQLDGTGGPPVSFFFITLSLKRRFSLCF